MSNENELDNKYRSIARQTFLDHCRHLNELFFKTRSFRPLYALACRESADKTYEYLVVADPTFLELPHDDEGSGEAAIALENFYETSYELRLAIATLFQDSASDVVNLLKDQSVYVKVSLLLIPPPLTSLSMDRMRRDGYSAVIEIVADQIQTPLLNAGSPVTDVE